MSKTNEAKKDEDKAISKKDEVKLMGKKWPSSPERTRLMLLASATAEELKKYQKERKLMMERNVIPPFLAYEPARPRAKARPTTTSSPSATLAPQATPEARTVPTEPVDLTADAGGEDNANAYDGAEVNVEVDELKLQKKKEKKEKRTTTRKNGEIGGIRLQSSYGKAKGKNKGRGKYKGKNKSKSKSGKGYCNYNQYSDHYDHAPWKRWW